MSDNADVEHLRHLLKVKDETIKRLNVELLRVTEEARHLDQRKFSIRQNKRLRKSAKAFSAFVSDDARNSLRELLNTFMSIRNVTCLDEKDHSDPVQQRLHAVVEQYNMLQDAAIELEDEVRQHVERLEGYE